jgi:hypothetical protein
MIDGYDVNSCMDGTNMNTYQENTQQTAWISGNIISEQATLESSVISGQPTKLSGWFRSKFWWGDELQWYWLKKLLEDWKDWIICQTYKWNWIQSLLVTSQYLCEAGATNWGREYDSTLRSDEFKIFIQQKVGELN